MHLRSVVNSKRGSLGRPSGAQVMVVVVMLAGVLMLVTSLSGDPQHPIDLKVPGLRLKKDPSVVIPAPYAYANRSLSLPHYRNPKGEPTAGWARKYIATRRFNSDQSAWIYYRLTDRRRCVILNGTPEDEGIAIWPGGCCIVIESYDADMPDGPTRPPMGIDVMAKAERNTGPYDDVFFAAEWSYARFTTNGDRVSAEVRDCHQCHSIAFQLTGDNIFSHLP